MKSLVAVATLILLAAFRLSRAVIGTVGLEHDLGLLCAVLGAASLALFRFTLPIRVGAILGLIGLWGWPWYAALLFAAPRLLLLLPGLISSAIAKRRHPRPLWPSPTAA